MLIISKEFNATPKQVFNAWSKAESIVAWWGPEGFTTEVKTFDFKPGGTFHYVIKDGKGMDMWGLFSYQEIREPNHLIFINSFSNPAAEVVKAPEVPFGKHWPLKMINTLRLDEKDGITTLELTIEPYQATTEERNTFNANTQNVKMGFEGTFTQLTNFLKSRL